MSVFEQPPVRVLVVDDAEEFRRALCAVVEATPGFALAGAVASGEEAILSLAVALAVPQLVLVDVRMPGLDGIETAARIRRSHPEVSIVLLSASDHGAQEGSLEIADKREVSPDWLAAVWRRASAAE